MTLKKIYSLAALALLAFSGCGQPATLNPTPQAGMEFAVGFDQGYPPYGYLGNDGNYTGFDLDLAAEVARRNGWRFSAQPINWDTKDAELNTGAISAIWNGFTKEGREDQYTFSDPYMLNGQVVIVKAGSAINSLRALAGKNVVTQVDSAALNVLSTNQKALADTFASLQERDNYNTAFMELESGAVDAVACDLSIAEFQMAANPGAYVKLADPLSSEHYVVAFKKGRTALADAVTQTLREMSADGTAQRIAKKYAHDGLAWENWLLK
ncbi:transporter substrate-binding domain-containing protein [Arcanobacterium canis]